MINFIVENMHEKRASPVKTQLILEKDDMSTYNATFTPQHKYRLTASMYVNFWANSAEYDRQYKQALRIIQNELYKDILSDLDTIMFEAGNYDYEKVITLCSDLRRRLTKGE